MFKRLFNRSTKTHQVVVEPFGATITVGAKETILQAALKAGLAYPYECQTGACSTCKTQLIEGDIKALTDFAYILEMEEIQRGTILACQSLAKTDLTIRVETLDDGLPSIIPTTRGAKISTITPLTRDILDVRLRLDDPIQYYAGQYANLSVPGVALPRSYSFASAPVAQGTRELSFHIRLIPGGEVSGWFAASDRTNADVTVDGPYGIFRVRESDGPIICIAGGSGMAPIKAMLEYGSQQRIERSVVYLYGARTQADLYNDLVVRALTDAWQGTMRFVPVLSEEPDDSDWTGARGYVSDFIQTIEDFEIAGCQAYLCGPPPMIDAALPILAKAGVRGRDTFFDKFTDRSHP